MRDSFDRSLSESKILVWVQCCLVCPAGRWPTRSNIKLANGMKVIVKEDHRAPVVVSQVWYRAGSMDEFNGIDRRGACAGTHDVQGHAQACRRANFPSRIAAAGGRENAFTSRDYTAYFQQLQKSSCRWR